MFLKQTCFGKMATVKVESNQGLSLESKAVNLGNAEQASPKESICHRKSFNKNIAEGKLDFTNTCPFLERRPQGKNSFMNIIRKEKSQHN